MRRKSIILSYIFVTLIFSLSGFAYTNENYSVNPPANWVENPKAFGMDVIMNSPFVANQRPLQLLFVTVKKEIENDIMLFLKNDFKRNAHKKNWDQFSIISEKKKDLPNKNSQLYCMQAMRMVKNNKILSMSAIIPLKKQYLYIYFEANNKLYREYIEKVLSVISKVIIKEKI